jgi:hypothetical protein
VECPPTVQSVGGTPEPCGDLGLLLHQQGPNHRVVLPRQQPLPVGQSDGPGEELGGDSALKQPLPFTGQGGNVPRRRLHIEADKLAEVQVVLVLLDLLPVATN